MIRSLMTLGLASCCLVQYGAEAALEPAPYAGSYVHWRDPARPAATPLGAPPIVRLITAQTPAQPTPAEASPHVRRQPQRWAFVTRADGVDYYVRTFPLAWEGEANVWAMTRQVGRDLGTDEDGDPPRQFRIVRKEIEVGFNCRDREVRTEGQLSHGPHGEARYHMYGFGGKPPADDPYGKMGAFACRHLQTEPSGRGADSPPPSQNERSARFTAFARENGVTYAASPPSTPEPGRFSVLVRLFGPGLGRDFDPSRRRRFTVSSAYERLEFDCTSAKILSSGRDLYGPAGETRYHYFWSTEWTAEVGTPYYRLLERHCGGPRKLAANLRPSASRYAQ